MESTFYVIIVILVFLKIIIWGCVFYSRSQRARHAQAPQLIISDHPYTRPIQGMSSDRQVIVIEDTGRSMSGIDNMAAPAPPSYEEVTRMNDTKPPSYEQIFKDQQQVQTTITE